MKIDVLNKDVKYVDPNNRAHISYELQFWDNENNPIEYEEVQVFEDKLLIYDTDTDVEGKAKIELIQNIITEVRKTLDFVVGKHSRSKVFLLEIGDEKVKKSFAKVDEIKKTEEKNIGNRINSCKRFFPKLDVGIVEENGRLILMNGKGVKLSTNAFDEIEDFSSNLSVARIGTKSYLINSTGEILSDWYDKVKVVRSVFSIAERGVKSVLLNHEGKTILDWCDDIRFDSNLGIYVAMRAGKELFLDQNGETIIDWCDDIEKINGSDCRLSFNKGHVSLYSGLSDGKFKDSLRDLDSLFVNKKNERIMVGEKKGKYVLITVKDNNFKSNVVDEISGIYGNLLFATINGKYTILDGEGNDVIVRGLDGISSVGIVEGIPVFIVSDGKNYSILDDFGKEVLSCCDNIVPSSIRGAIEVENKGSLAIYYGFKDGRFSGSINQIKNIERIQYVDNMLRYNDVKYALKFETDEGYGVIAEHFKTYELFDVIEDFKNGLAVAYRYKRDWPCIVRCTGQVSSVETPMDSPYNGFIFSAETRISNHLKKLHKEVRDPSHEWRGVKVSVFNDKKEIKYSESEWILKVCGKLKLERNTHKTLRKNCLKIYVIPVPNIPLK